MHSAVDLILNRMKSNPDDFMGNSRWMQAVHDYKKHFTEEETKAVMDAIRELRMTQLQDKLFGLLTQEEPRDIDIDLFGNAPIVNSGQPVYYGNQGLSTITSTTGTATATGLPTWVSPKQEIEELKLELQKIRLQQELDLELNKFHGISDE